MRPQIADEIQVIFLHFSMSQSLGETRYTAAGATEQTVN